MQQILSCVQGALPWGSQLYPQAKIPAAKDCKLLASTPFSQTGLHGRQGLDRDSCMCLPVTDSPSWGRDLLSSSVGVSKHQILLAEALSGKETSGQGGCVAKDELEIETTSTICQGHFIPGKLSLHFVNYAWGCLSYYWNAAVPRAEDINNILAQCNNMKNSALQIILQDGFKIGIWYYLD